MVANTEGTSYSIESSVVQLRVFGRLRNASTVVRTMSRKLVTHLAKLA